MLYLLIQSLWYLTPAMWSNMAPVWAAKLPQLDFLDIPVDANKKLFGKPLFGRNKTYRGFAAGLVFALFIGMLQYLASEWFPVINRLEFFEMAFGEYVYLSLLLGFGALAGDAVESMLKRQLNIKPGDALFPFDQIDYVIGALLFSIPIGALQFSEYLGVLFVGFAIHPVSTFIGWKLGLKDKPI